ncbi:MAG: oligopeptide:H+ symporter [Chiayiivirga sp.]|jgi:POT family proton-dependent oligopeptide transporter|uniref:POT-type proton-dependent oligopeptide transporter n=1 Tax=Chiayiivirga sp. TaxID=2041042 RepID=UPI0025C2F213|nr:oligopeptide:H+ symporter [Chiayiivirga sp.]MCI1711647.1 oligopeptide:H+ symporter [Chiayiivirga sp.]MCI1729778.1 oligopeptide:H+ symporter [Chiayiivirga sp.]
MSTAPAARMPRQIPYILGNEACERFSFYGMRNILVPFLATSMLLYLPEGDRPGAAKDIFHIFVIGVYFFPLLGGWLADRVFGKYRTVLWFSLIYCAGNGMLALFPHHEYGFYSGLFLIALGSGGIKPLVASFMGDQFDKSNKHLAKIAFDAFYWIINFGSLFASLLMPYFLREHGPAVAFGIPGALMFLATVVFWMGRRKYVHVAPVSADPHAFLNVVRTALLARGEHGSRPGLVVAVIGAALALAAFALIPYVGFVSAFCIAIVLLIAFGGFGAALQLERARGTHPDEAVQGVRAVLGILIAFALITPFWSLFDQKASTWVLQAGGMTKPDWFEPAQMQALNPLLVMLLIPFNNLVLYPTLRKFGIEMSAMRRITIGIAFSGLAWIAAGGLQLAMDGGDAVSITWQILPYVLLTMGEVWVSATGLEFAYSQAPASMKGVIMSFWYLGVTIGNLWVLLANAAVRNDFVTGQIAGTGLSVAAFQMFFFAGFALLAALAFGWYARRYKEVDNYRAA